MAYRETAPSTTATREALTSFDILGVIFKACLALDISLEWQNDVRQKITLGAVCKLWKFTLESTPALWSHIILMPQMPQYYIHKVFWLARHARKHLSINLDLSSQLISPFSSSIADLLVAAAKTVTSISVQYSSYSDWDTFVNYISATNPHPNFTSLRRFSATRSVSSWSAFDADLPRLFPGAAVDLQHLHLDGLPLSSFVVGPNLISLALTNLVQDHPASSDFAATFLDSLRQTPHLETLIIDVNESFTTRFDTHRPLTLPCLHTLSFLCNMQSPHPCGFLISLIKLPKLHTLSLGLASNHNSHNFISANETHLSTITLLRLIGHISLYIDLTSGPAKLLSSLTGSKLRHLDFLNTGGLFTFDAERQLWVQTQFLEILAHALTLPAVRLLVIRPLRSTPHSPSATDLIRSLLEPVSTRGEVKHIFEEHALCPVSGGGHSNCGRLWSWDFEGLQQASRASHSTPGIRPLPSNYI
ncbi:hypothetical protein MIND_01135000 [Mycena indigotica]|uniref:F-box domain-containing protein n=1 Tax=Mycena indigotica TaxID=2126181 RepID=A0A8H6VTQ0_9AGAR|nr:uncharacterized protein MIND_01135000 [Mycena indigotica]KAF7293564.1 hypothetical protein MIND_01135000 [Mycena indigotica]